VRRVLTQAFLFMQDDARIAGEVKSSVFGLEGPKNVRRGVKRMLARLKAENSILRRSRDDLGTFPKTALGECHGLL
jgi:hypothetical protein